MMGIGSIISCVSLVLCIHFVTSAVTTVRWCTISTHEEAKCMDMKTAFATHSLLDLNCVVSSSARDCMTMISSNRADLVTLDGGDVYQAGLEFGMVPIMSEQYASDTDGYFAIAVVRKDTPDINIENLRGKKSCHTGVRKTAGWNVPVGFLLEKGFMNPTGCQDDIRAAGLFFSESCAPGALSPDYNPHNDNPESLCALCLSPDCSRSSSEDYYNYDGAFRCLAERAGDVAFIKPVTLTDYTDGKSDEDWARSLRSQDFELLCPDGSRAQVGEERSCNLAFVPSHAVMTSNKWDANVQQDFRALLNQAQELFGEDVNNNGFSMFDSSPYPGGSDLLFKDSAKSLKDVIGKTYAEYLGESYIGTLTGLAKCPTNTLRWCVTSDIEKKKCRDMSLAFHTQAFIRPVVSCYQSFSGGACAADIANDKADLVTLDAGLLYRAGREQGVSPIMAEDYGEGDVSYWGVAVVKKTSTFTINELKGKKSCHTGYMRTVGWNIPVGFLINRKEITVDDNCDIPKAVGNYFSQSCAPGIQDPKNDPEGTHPDNLCALCAGTGVNKCMGNADEPYSGYTGAFRCLVEGGGDVAFVKHVTVGDNTGGSNADAWAAGLNKADYQLLCPDGSRAEVDDYMTCNLAKVPSHAVVTSGMKTIAQKEEMVKLLTDGQLSFNDESGTGFKMFDSSNYTNAKDLLFKDSTVQLLPTVEKDTYDKFLTKEYLEDTAAIYCEPLTESPGGGSTLLPSLLVMMVTLAIHHLARG